MLEGDNLSVTKTLSPLLPVGSLQPVVLWVRICHGPTLQISVKASGKQLWLEVLQRHCKREQKPASHHSPAAHILVGKRQAQLGKRVVGRVSGETPWKIPEPVFLAFILSHFSKKKKIGRLASLLTTWSQTDNVSCS